MKQKIIDFLKDKFNMSLIVLQVVAIISYFLAAYFLFFILFYLCESAFLIVWGVKFIVTNKNFRYKMDVYSQLPYTEAQKEQIRKNNEKTTKNNKMMAAMLILLGVVFLFAGFSMIF